MMRNLAGRSIDTLGLLLILLAPGVIGFHSGGCWYLSRAGSFFESGGSIDGR